MYPLRNNLLSPRKKTLLKRITHIQFIKSLLEILLIFVSLIGIVLLGAQNVLEQYFNQLTNNTVSVNNEHAEEIRNIMRINQILRNTNAIQQDYIGWAEISADMMDALTHDGIDIDLLSMNGNNNTLSISGSADTREAYLSFQQQLREYSCVDAPCITQVEAPISSLTQRENIPFSFTATLDTSVYEN